MVTASATTCLLMTWYVDIFSPWRPGGQESDTLLEAKTSRIMIFSIWSRRSPVEGTDYFTFHNRSLFGLPGWKNSALNGLTITHLLRPDGQRFFARIGLPRQKKQNARSATRRHRCAWHSNQRL